MYRIVRFILRMCSVVALATVMPMVFIWAWTGWDWYDLQEEIDWVGEDGWGF
jgi:hypothetical protein